MTKPKNQSEPLKKVLKIDNQADLEAKLAKVKESLINGILGQAINEVAWQRMIVDKKHNTIPKEVLESQLNKTQNDIQVYSKQLEVVRDWLHELGSKL